MRTGLLGAVALLALGSCIHVCRAQNSTTKTLYQYLTALEHNQTFYYEPADPGYYASINNNTIIEYNGTFYEDLNGTFYALQRQANGSFTIPANATGIAEGLSPDGIDYGQVLGLSWLFYEAQRSGPLPPTNRIPFRGDSALQDAAPGGAEMKGGWYDAGDFLKLNFPAAFSASLLAWGLIEFQDGYTAAGQTEAALDSLRWIADYFVKNHHGDLAFTGQIGNVGDDHASWGRPEDMTEPRPGFDLTPTAPGSDLLGQTVAALAAIAIVFQNIEPSYSNMLEAHARDLYVFATAYEGKYSDAINQAYVYPSSNYLDDIAWGAAWLYQRTGEQQFLTEAEAYNQRNIAEEGGGGYVAFVWDCAYWGTQVKLAEFTGTASYATEVSRFLDTWVTGTAPVMYTPSGLAWASEWGTLRYTMNAALIAEVWSKKIATTDATNSNRYECWARSQTKYVLGSDGLKDAQGVSISFVVGFGTKPPVQAHHRAASCPNPPAPCSFDNFNAAVPNPHILYGALVGGPGADDSYVDVRSDYTKNEVAVDYNAGFTGVLAALSESSNTWASCVAGNYLIARGNLG
ncbi:hypothetical protein ABBQ38_002447 [Trebouxia sp. C0009 RCD-2024]